MAQTDIYKLAKELANELKNSDVFTNLESALAEVRSDELANNVFETFRKTQQDIQTIQETGGQPTEQDIQKWQAAAQQAQGVEQIEKLSEAEQKINAILQEINDLITDPLNKIY